MTFSKQFGALALVSEMPPSVEALAKKLLADAPRYDIYAFPRRGTLVYYLAATGDGHVCVIVADGGVITGGCYRSADELAEGKAGLTVTVVANGYSIVAPVPDGSRGAVIEWRSGKQQPLIISGNLLTTVVRQLPERISWTSGDGTPREFVIGDDLLSPPAK